MHRLSIILFCATMLGFMACARANSSETWSNAIIEHSKGHEAEFRRIARNLCESGNLEAQLGYGRFLIGKQEYQEAETWLLQASKSGTGESQYM
ncbi:hypothetical protein, partial [Roseateles sp. P5_E11]